METMSPMERLRYNGLPVALLTQLPLWLLTFVFSTELFRIFHLPRWVASLAMLLAVLIIAYLASRWELDASLMVMILPIVLLFGSDTIAASYNTPFLLCSVAITAAGIYAYQKLEDHKWRLLVLFGAFALSIWVHGHAVNAYWDAFGASLANCPSDCVPVPGPDTTWWALFFTP